MITRRFDYLWVLPTVLTSFACSSSPSSNDSAATGGMMGAAGNTPTGGAAAVAGSASGGDAAGSSAWAITGGNAAIGSFLQTSGGHAAAGGDATGGNAIASGGSLGGKASGGNVATGGAAQSTGGDVATGGTVQTTGGSAASGGRATGGKASGGVATVTGGNSATAGGNVASGGTAQTTGGNAANGGDSSVGGQASWPTEPPARICGNTELLTGPATAPVGAVIIPAGDNQEFFANESYKHEDAAGTVYYFQTGVHYLGSDEFAQIIPASNTTFIGAPGAILDGQGVNFSAFTQKASNVRVAYLEIRNFGAISDNHDQGVVNHDAGSGWTIEYNYIHHNGGAGAFVGTQGTLRYNCLADNGQYGFQSGGGATDLVVDHNEVARNNQADWETRQPGCGCTGGCKFWEARRAKITNNWVHDNLGAGIWADYNNVEFLIENNLVEGNDREGIEYEISFNFMIRYNTIRRNCITRGKAESEGFPWGAIYISEAGGDSRAGSVYTVSEIHHNYLEDNWDGIVLWENSDRFCRPNENDVTAMCPFFDQTFGTRFKTQNVSVHDNVFSFDKAKVGCTGMYCGRNGIFSQSSSNPTYPGDTIKDAITKAQNNHFASNTYRGPWAFTIWDQSDPKPWSVWRGSPWNQDPESTLTP